MEEILRIVELHKSYQENKAVNGISFNVRRGEILCILGPNGAGKSTTIQMFSGALRCGSARLFHI